MAFIPQYYPYKHHGGHHSMYDPRFGFNYQMGGGMGDFFNYFKGMYPDILGYQGQSNGQSNLYSQGAQDYYKGLIQGNSAYDNYTNKDAYFQDNPYDPLGGLSIGGFESQGIPGYYEAMNTNFDQQQNRIDDLFDKDAKWADKVGNAAQQGLDTRRGKWDDKTGGIFNQAKSERILETGSNIFSLLQGQEAYDNQPKSEDLLPQNSGHKGFRYKLGGKPFNNLINTTGYKRGTPTFHNPFNIIPGGNITMQGVDSPVLAMPSDGKPVVMQPGQDYNFPEASYVVEKKLNNFQAGGGIDNTGVNQVMDPNGFNQDVYNLNSYYDGSGNLVDNPNVNQWKSGDPTPPINEIATGMAKPYDDPFTAGIPFGPQIGKLGLKGLKKIDSKLDDIFTNIKYKKPSKASENFVKDRYKRAKLAEKYKGTLDLDNSYVREKIDDVVKDGESYSIHGKYIHKMPKKKVTDYVKEMKESGLYEGFDDDQLYNRAYSVLNDVWQGNKVIVNPHSPDQGKTLVHELTHRATEGNKGITDVQKQLAKKFTEENPSLQGFDEYLRRPTEIHARLNELRYLIDPKNPTRHDYTKEEIVKVLKKNDLHKVIPGLGKYEQADYIKKLMKVFPAVGAGAVAANQYKYGGNMRQYQLGGDPVIRGMFRNRFAPQNIPQPVPQFERGFMNPFMGSPDSTVDQRMQIRQGAGFQNPFSNVPAHKRRPEYQDNTGAVPINPAGMMEHFPSMPDGMDILEAKSDLAKLIREMKQPKPTPSEIKQLTKDGTIDKRVGTHYSKGFGKDVQALHLKDKSDVEDLQRAMGMTGKDVDGVFGPKTAEQFKNWDPNGSASYTAPKPKKKSSGRAPAPPFHGASQAVEGFLNPFMQQSNINIANTRKVLGFKYGGKVEFHNPFK